MPFNPGELEAAFDAQGKAYEKLGKYTTLKLFTPLILLVIGAPEGFGIMNDLSDGKIDYGNELLLGLVATVAIPGGLYLYSNWMISRTEPDVKKADDELRGVLSRGTGLDL